MTYVELPDFLEEFVRKELSILLSVFDSGESYLHRRCRVIVGLVRATTAYETSSFCAGDG